MELYYYVAAAALVIVFLTMKPCFGSEIFGMRPADYPPGDFGDPRLVLID
jgi:hypothetical protein